VLLLLSRFYHLESDPVRLFVCLFVFPLQYFNTLNNHVETATGLGDKPGGNLIEGVLGGKLQQTVQCVSGCDHASESVQSFSVLQCGVKGRANLSESFDALFAGEVIDEYRCSQCDEVRNAEKRFKIAELPQDTLILHLKRFEFDFDTSESLVLCF
jgi:Ubiquitin carboxyl-terminal hydrolase